MAYIRRGVCPAVNYDDDDDDDDTNISPGPRIEPGYFCVAAHHGNHSVTESVCTNERKYIKKYIHVTLI